MALDRHMSKTFCTKRNFQKGDQCKDDVKIEFFMKTHYSPSKPSIEYFFIIFFSLLIRSPHLRHSLRFTWKIDKLLLHKRRTHLRNPKHLWKVTKRDLTFTFVVPFQFFFITCVLYIFLFIFFGFKKVKKKYFITFFIQCKGNNVPNSASDIIIIIITIKSTSYFSSSNSFFVSFTYMNVCVI